MSLKIFLSHSKADAEKLQPLIKEARSWEVELYLYENDPRPGQYVAEKVQGEITTSDLFFVLISKRSQYSAYVHQEIGFAEAQGKTIIPLVEEGVEPKNLGMLEGREYISFDPENPDAYLNQVREYLKGIVELAAEVVAIVVIVILAVILAILMAGASGTRSLRG